MRTGPGGRVEGTACEALPLPHRLLQTHTLNLPQPWELMMRLG